MYNFLERLEDKFWLWYFKKHVGVGAQHVILHWQEWEIGVWNKAEFLAQRGSMELSDFLDKIREENPKTTFKPKDIQRVLNILTNTGMTHAGKLNTGELTTFWTNVAIGKGSAAEDVNNTTLQTEEKRKAFAVGGNAKVVNQTEKYSHIFYDTDMVSALPVTITEAGIFHQAAGGDMYARVVAAGKVVNTGDLITVQINVTHINGTQV